MRTFELLVLSDRFGSPESAREFCADVYDGEDEDRVTSPLRTAMHWERVDTDFVEAIHGAGRFDYLRSILVTPGEADEVEIATRDDDALVLVFLVEGNAALSASPQRTDRSGLTYCGRFRGVWR